MGDGEKDVHQDRYAVEKVMTARLLEQLKLEPNRSTVSARINQIWKSVVIAELISQRFVEPKEVPPVQWTLDDSDQQYGLMWRTNEREWSYEGQFRTFKTLNPGFSPSTLYYKCEGALDSPLGALFHRLSRFDSKKSHSDGLVIGNLDWRPRKGFHSLDVYRDARRATGNATAKDYILEFEGDKFEIGFVIYIKKATGNECPADIEDEVNKKQQLFEFTSSYIALHRESVRKGKEALAWQ